MPLLPTVLQRSCGTFRCLVLLAALALVASACSDEEPQTAATEGDRVTVSIAVLDDMAHRAALYAIEQRIVTSPTVDPVLTYLPPSAIDETARSKQHDVIEASPLTVALGAAEDFEFVILSAGIQDLDGTLLFVNADAALDTPADLDGKALGVASRGDPSTLAVRYLLQQRYDLDAGAEADGVTLEAAPAESLSPLLQEDEVDAVVMPPAGAFRLADDDGFRVLSHVAADVAELTGAPMMNSVLVTYPDAAETKAAALHEMDRLLVASVTYFKSNRDTVIEAVASEQGGDEEFLRWWWERYDLPLGDLSQEAQEGLIHAWEAARALGDIEGYPDLAEILLPSEAPTPASEE